MSYTKKPTTKHCVFVARRFQKNMDTKHKIAERLAAYNACFERGEGDASIEVFSDLTFRFKLEMWGCIVAQTCGGVWGEVTSIPNPDPYITSIIARFQEIDAASPFEL